MRYLISEIHSRGFIMVILGFDFDFCGSGKWYVGELLENFVGNFIGFKIA